MISLNKFEKWLDAYGAAWQSGDANAAIKLFTEDASYHETPFDEPMVGLDAIRQYWSEGAGESHKDVSFMYQGAVVVEDRGLAQWQANFVRIPSGNQVELDGFFMATFDAAGKCSVFREWWHRRERASD